LAAVQGKGMSIKRKHMVDEQLSSRDIIDKRVLAAFKKIPRHAFIPNEHLTEAYNDYPINIGLGQTISQPYMVALMAQCAMLKGNEKVLEVGTGSGYGAAILSRLAKEVISIERHRELGEKTEKVLRKLNITNIQIIVGDGTKGYLKEAPYDAIIVTAYAREAPKVLIDQLKENGRLVIPLGNEFSQELIVITRTSKGLQEDSICGCRFVPLVED
jgi:protein-L-isoaspartate(D-aspartate) O-methyltransferase